MRLRLAAAMCAALLAAGPALAQGDICPERTIRFMIPFPPGGSTDALARLIQPRMSELLGRTIVVENRGGAAGSIGTAAAAAAPGDGCTVLFVFDTHATNPTLIPNLPFDTRRDLAPLMLVGTNAMVVTAHRSTPYTDFRQVIAEGKQPGKEPAYGSIGNGSLAHLAMTQLQTLGGFGMTHVPYRGGGPLVQDAAAGNVPLAMATIVVLRPQMDAGTIRPLAITGAERHPALPNTPTMRELGFEGFEAYAWWGILMPSRTPKPMQARMHAALADAIGQPQARERLAGLGMDLRISDPETFERFLNAEIDRWGQVIRENNITPG